MKIIGVTGTNGKTTIVHFICNLLKNYVNCASFGTLGINQYLDNKCISTKTNLTTLANDDLKYNLTKVFENKCELVAMEVSSHGLAQKRVENINFTSAIFTNLSHEHLDYHKTMEHYFDTKFKLFTEYGAKLKHAIINTDDLYGQKIAKQLAYYNNNINIIEIKFNNICENIEYHQHGISTYINTPWGKGKLNTKILGSYNLFNLLLSIFTCMVNYENINFTELLDYCNELKTPSGRIKLVANKIIIDYAHTPYGLEHVLLAIKQHYPQQKICCVFGCGGGRDVAKRPMMLKVADQYCNVVILTQDNSRQENPESIITDILSYKTKNLAINPIIELDRKAAIEKAIKYYYQDHIILIAGKGHETIQIIGDREYPFCDKSVVEELL